MSRTLFHLSLLCVIGSVWSNDKASPEVSSGLESKKTAVVISSLPENFKLIIGETDTPFYLPRVKEIHALPAHLPPDQVAAAYGFLAKKIETQTLPDLEFNGLKNELTVALMKQNRKPEALAENLVKMYRDKSYDETWRDYCVQFFGKWYPAAPDNAGRQAMVEGLWDALKTERGNRIAGAAASQLSFLTKQYPDQFDQAKVAAACLEALNDPKCAAISKVPLLQACAVLGEAKALPAARKLAESGNGVLLRVSAIGAIGLLGDRGDLPLLEKLSGSSDLRLQRPAQAAIGKINSRHTK